MSTPWPRDITIGDGGHVVTIEPGAGTGTVFLRTSTRKTTLEPVLTVEEARAVIEALTDAARDATAGGGA